jgi:hypothetical protein
MRSPSRTQNELPGFELEHDREALWRAWLAMPRHERLDFEAALAFPPLRRGLARQAAAAQMAKACRPRGSRR